MKPDQRGAIKLARVHGNQLLCVRYRENADGDERLTTIELVVERAVIQKRADDVVSFRIKPGEVELQAIARSKGAIFDGKTKMWKLKRREVLRMGLRHRIAMPLSQIFQEHVLP
jgi:hypothetical protein